MVKNIILCFSLFLVGCSNFNEDESKLTQVDGIMVNEKISDAEKEAQDNDYLGSLIELKATDIEFLTLVKYVINCFNEETFLDNDIILGKKEFLSSKDFTNPRTPYVNFQIPKYDDIRVKVIYDENKNLDTASVGYVSGANFIINGNLNIIKALDLKFIKKEKLEFSNKIYTYYYTDGKFNYEIEAESSSNDEQYPSKFYSFLMKKNF